MLIAVSEYAFPPQATLDDAIARAASAGFAGLEPAIHDRGLLTLESTELQCRAIGQRIRAGRLAIPALACCSLPCGRRAWADVDVRRSALEQAREALRRAAWLGTDTLLLAPSAERPGDARRSRVRREDVVHHIREALLELQYDAESCGVVIACGDLRGCVSASPLEVRQFLDDLATPWVAACVDTADARGTADLLDWIGTLGPRIRCVRVSDRLIGAPGYEDAVPPDEIDWPAAIAALRDADYDGPLTITASDDVQGLHERIRRATGL